MGLLDSITGMFKEKAKGVSFEEARAIALKEFEDEKKSLTEFSSWKFAEISHLVRALSKDSAFLESQKINVEDGNKRFRQIVSTSQKNLARQLQGLSQKIMPPKMVELNSVRSYSRDSLRAISRDLLPYWKNVALTKLLLKDEIKSIGENLKELFALLEELDARASSEKLVTLEVIALGFSNLASSQDEESTFAKSISEKKTDVQASERKVSSIKSQISMKRESKEAAELEELLKRRSELEGRANERVSAFNSEIAPAEKVLKRMYSLSQSGQMLKSEEREVLRMILESPQAAFISDPKGIVSKSLLLRAKEMINEGSIKLKDAERDKRLNAISLLLNKDFFTEYFWEMNNIKASMLTVDKKISSLGVSGELKELKLSLASFSKELEAERLALHRLEAQKGQFYSLSLKKRGALFEQFNSYFEGRFSVRS